MGFRAPSGPQGLKAIRFRFAVSFSPSSPASRPARDSRPRAPLSQYNPFRRKKQEIRDDKEAN